MSRPEDDPTRSFAWSAVPPDRPRVLVFWEGGSASRPLEPGASLLLGRADDCDIQVLHPSVSRHHARLHVGPPLRIEELGSSRGTRINGKVFSKGTVAIEPGQVVELGGAMLVVQEPGSASLPSAGASANVTGAPPMDLERFVALVSKSQLTVLILGETGSGKEVMAERIHRASPRASGPLVKLNCAAFPEALLESELFGHERGAFTGAVSAKPGLIESADKGTLLLDEIGEMPPGTQAKLLRVIETREVRRVGAVETFAVDVRILAATHRDLEALVTQGAFRQDLLYRLNGVTIRVPPLRDRPGELASIARELLERAAREAGIAAPPITPAAEATLLRHAWPGNVRELRNVLERALVLSEGGPIDSMHLLLGETAAPAPTLGAKIESFERDQIVRALEEADGNQTRAAQILGMSRRALINRIEAYGLPRPRKT